MLCGLTLSVWSLVSDLLCCTGKAAKKNQKKRAKRKEDHEQEGWDASSANGSNADPHAAGDGLQAWDSASAAGGAGDAAGAESSSAGGGRFITSESCLLNCSRACVVFLRLASLIAVAVWEPVTPTASTITGTDYVQTGQMPHDVIGRSLRVISDAEHA
jgi:hypothetical protein